MCRDITQHQCVGLAPGAVPARGTAPSSPKIPPQTFCLRALAACPSPARPKSHPVPPGSQRCCGSTGRAPRPPAEEGERLGLALRALGAAGAGDAPHPLQPCPHHIHPSWAPAACRNGLVPGAKTENEFSCRRKRCRGSCHWGKESSSCWGPGGLQRDFLGLQLRFQRCQVLICSKLALLCAICSKIVGFAAAGSRPARVLCVPLQLAREGWAELSQHKNS